MTGPYVKHLVHTKIKQKYFYLHVLYNLLLRGPNRKHSPLGKGSLYNRSFFKNNFYSRIDTLCRNKAL